MHPILCSFRYYAESAKRKSRCDSTRFNCNMWSWRIFRWYRVLHGHTHTCSWNTFWINKEKRHFNKTESLYEFRYLWYWIAILSTEISVYLFEDKTIKDKKTYLSGMVCESFVFKGLKVKLDGLFMWTALPFYKCYSRTLS